MSTQDLAALVANLNLHAVAPIGVAESASSTAISVHTLHLLYPACDLLPLGVSLPALDPPLPATVMDEPPVDKQVLGISDTSFYAELQVKPSPVLPPLIQAFPHLAVLAMVAQSTMAAGSTTLKAVRYWKTSAQAMMYRLSFIEQADLHAFDAAQIFELDASQYESLMACGEHFPWIKLLQGLVLRTSYRAVYHVREQLTKYYGMSGAEFEEHSWSAAWVSDMYKPPLTNEEGGIMQAKESTMTFVREHTVWQALDMAVTSGGPGYEVHSMTIFRALHAALQSLDTPTLICPRLLNPVAHDNTKLALDDFERTLYGINFNQRATPSQLHSNLSCQANVATTSNSVDLHVHLANLDPEARWQQFLKAWLTRAVNFVCRRKCSEKGIAHTGMHRHGVDQFYSPAEWEQDIDVNWEEEDDDTIEGLALPRVVRELDQMLNIADLSR